MPLTLSPQTPVAEHQSELCLPRAARQTDPAAYDFQPHADGRRGMVDTAAALQRKAREHDSNTDAMRVVANHRLDAGCGRFGSELTLDVGRDRKSARWKQFFGSSTITAFCKQALGKQVLAVLAWEPVIDALFDRHKPEILKWAKAADVALKDTAATASVRG